MTSVEMVDAAITESFVYFVHCNTRSETLSYIDQPHFTSDLYKSTSSFFSFFFEML